jgi:hypothetical protein
MHFPIKQPTPHSKIYDLPSIIEKDNGDHAFTQNTTPHHQLASHLSFNGNLNQKFSTL